MANFQYFKVRVEKLSAAPFFNLHVQRLVKKKEAVASGFAPMDQYMRCCEIRGVPERDAQCIVMALENPRPPLKKGLEEEHWKNKTMWSKKPFGGFAQGRAMPPAKRKKRK